MQALSNALSSLFVPAASTRHSRFQRGSGAFDCSNCGRSTRDTGDNGQCRLCPQCFDLAGYENSLVDGRTFGKGGIDTVRSLLSQLASYIGAERAGSLHPDLVEATGWTPPLDLSATEIDKKAVTKVATAVSSTRKATEKPGRAVKVKGAKAQELVCPPLSPEIQAEVVEMDLLIAALVAEVDAEESARIAENDRVNGTFTLKLHPRPEYTGDTSALLDVKIAKAVKNGVTSKGKPKNAKQPAAKKAPSGTLSAGMAQELAACAAGTPTNSKVGSVMRMHLKMRGYIVARDTGELTEAGRAVAASIVQ